MDNPDKPDNPDQQPSVAGLSDLVHEEEEKATKPTEPAGPSLPSDMPAFGAAPGSEAPKEPEWEPPPMTVTFWQKLAPQSRVRPIHFILGGLVLVLAGGAVAAVLVLRKPAQVEGKTAVVSATTAPADAEAKPATKSTPEANAAPTTPKPTPAAAADEAKKATTARATKPKTRKRKASRAKTEEASHGETAEAPPAKPAPEPEPEPAEPEVGGEPLTAKDIKVGVKQNMGKVKGCIKSAREAGLLAPGRHTFVLDWTIAASGAVTNAHMRGPARLLDTSLSKCFEGAMRRWKFRASPKGAPVKNFPFGPFNLK